MSRFLRICAVLSAMFFATNVFAAGYTCNDIKMYTSCNAGYYMSLNGTPNTTAQVGNACTLCPAGYYCPGGSASSNANARVACTAGSACTTTGLSAPNATCTAGYYCPSGSSSATAYDCDTGTTTASANNYWTSAAGAGARTSCYRAVTLNKNGMSGTLTLPTSSGCRSLTSNSGTTTVYVYYNTKCLLPTTALSGTATGTTYTGTGTWGTSATATTFSNYITTTSTAATLTYYAGKQYTCSAGYYHAA
ncbi:MAG: hypothetical protein IKB05_02445, partial [Alphaproteobacteria bacterium]|nr:hypothetical protein [Alphaproteobacteria bacterium]